MVILLYWFQEKVLAANSTIIYKKTSISESILSENEEDLEEDMEELIVVDDMEQRDEKDPEERSTGIRWGTELTEEEERLAEQERINAVKTLCREILDQIVEKIFDEVYYSYLSCNKTIIVSFFRTKLFPWAVLLVLDFLLIMKTTRIVQIQRTLMTMTTTTTTKYKKNISFQFKIFCNIIIGIPRIFLTFSTTIMCRYDILVETKIIKK